MDPKGNWLGGCGLVQGSDKWQAVVNVVMNLRMP
jgi:hypothetical protein